MTSDYSVINTYFCEMMRYTPKQVILLFVWIFILTSCTHENPGFPSSPPASGEGFPENVIFFVGDGMGLGHITAAMTVNGGYLNCTDLPVAGLVTTHAADSAVTGSAASGTAMSTGHKVNYSTLGVDKEGNPLKNLFEYFHSCGIVTGIVTTSELVDATPAAFYAHVPDRNLKEMIAIQMAYSSVEVLIGGGCHWLTERSDGLNLIDTMVLRGYDFYSDLDQVPSGQEGPLLVVLESYDLPGVTEGRGNMLQTAMNTAISRLHRTGKPFFLLVENNHIDHYAHANESDPMLAEILDLDQAIGQALSFSSVHKETLIVVGADHETGGFSIIGGNIGEGSVVGDFQGDNHTATMVPFFACGPGETLFSGVYDNTAVFDKFTRLMQCTAHP